MDFSAPNSCRIAASLTAWCRAASCAAKSAASLIMPGSERANRETPPRRNAETTADQLCDSRWGFIKTCLVPALWTAVEFLRGQIAFDGYPWYLLAHPLVAWLPLVQSADLLGAYFISFLAAMPAGFIVGIARNIPSVAPASPADKPCRV